MITQYYYSIDSVVNVQSIALVYTPKLLKKELVPQYAIGVNMFEVEVGVDADENGILSIVLEGREDYERLKFNHILILDDSHAAKAFVRLDSTINVAEMGIKKITVVFEYDIKTSFRSLSLTLDYSAHASDDAHAHKHLLGRGRRGRKIALEKEDVRGIGLSTCERQPYYASTESFSDKFVREGLMKHSGTLYFKNGDSMFMVEGNSFYVGNDTIHGFAEVDGRQAVVCSDGAYVSVCKEMEGGTPGESVYMPLAGMSVVWTSATHMVLRDPSENFFRLYAFEDVWREPSSPRYLAIRTDTQFISDAVTGAPMYYRLSPAGHIDWSVSSSSLRAMLDSTIIGADALPGNLSYVTDGLAIYMDKGAPTLCSSQTVSTPPYYNRFVAVGYDMAVPISSGAVLLRETSENDTKAWVMAELVPDEDSDSYKWELTDFGRDDGRQSFFPSIYKVAKANTTTPYSSILFGLEYKGLLYGRPYNGVIKSL